MMKLLRRIRFAGIVRSLRSRGVVHVTIIKILDLKEELPRKVPVALRGDGSAGYRPIAVVDNEPDDHGLVRRSSLAIFPIRSKTLEENADLRRIIVSIRTVSALDKFGRVRLSKSFFMRDFLFSEIAAINGMANVPDDPDLAVAAGTRLCTDLLEPLQDMFGRIAIRSAYRSTELNAFGNAKGHNCASNEANRAAHIWDLRDAEGCMGAVACIQVPSFNDRFTEDADWMRMAWWIHDHLPYSTLEFFSTKWAFNIGWHERPKRTIHSWYRPGPRLLTKPGMANHEGSHRLEWPI